MKRVWMKRALAACLALVSSLALAQDGDVEETPPEAEQAEAEPPAELSPQDARARDLFREGDELYSQGRYEEALANFEEAYELSQRPLLLYNIANAQERAGDWDEAVVTLERYLPHAYEAERGRIETRIESLKRRVARLREMREREAQGLRPQPRELGGPLLMSATAALLGGGIALSILAKGARDDLDSDCENVDGRQICMAGVRDSADRDLRMSVGADVLFIAAAGTFALGLWQLLKKDEDDELLEIEAGASPTAGMVRIRGQF